MLAPGQTSPASKCKGTIGQKITSCICRWSTLWTARYRKTKIATTKTSPTSTYEELDAKQGLCTQGHQGPGNTQPPIPRDPRPARTSRAVGTPPGRSAQGNATCSHCPRAAGPPGKPGVPRGAVLRHSPARCRRCEFSLWVGKIPWSRTWQPAPVFSPRKFRGQRSLEGYSPRGRRVRHD